jgi:hypothetical protein
MIPLFCLPYLLIHCHSLCLLDCSLVQDSFNLFQGSQSSSLESKTNSLPYLRNHQQIQRLTQVNQTEYRSCQRLIVIFLLIQFVPSITLLQNLKNSLLKRSPLNLCRNNYQLSTRFSFGISHLVFKLF